MVTNATEPLNITELSSNIQIALAMVVPQWCRNVMMIFIVIVFFTGLPGNVFVILVQINTKMKTTTDWFVGFLAASDLLSLVINVPCYIIIMKDEWGNIGSQFGCKIHHFVMILTFMAQTIIVACNAIDRLWKSSSVHQLLTPKSSKHSGVIVFVVSSMVSMIAAFAVHTNDLGQCVHDPSRKLLQLILYLIILISGLISSAVIIISYTRILLVLKARNRIVPMPNVSGNRFQDTLFSARIESRFRKAVRNTKIMFIVTFVFIITTIIPSTGMIIFSMTDFRQSDVGSILMFLLIRLYLINNCVNPYIYFCLNTTFRRKIAYILRSN